MTAEALQELTVETVAGLMDHLLLRPDHTLQDIEQGCEEAARGGFASVSLAPYTVPHAARILRGRGVAVCGAVGYPLGSSGLAAKCDEARTVVEGGAGEVDMVINLVAMKSGRYADVAREIGAIRRMATGLALKVTLECCYLTDTEKARACKLALEGGADVVKTGTGFGRTAVTLRDIHLLTRICEGRAIVEAVGGVEHFRQVVDLLRAGADRIGAADVATLMEEFYRWEAE